MDHIERRLLNGWIRKLGNKANLWLVTVYEEIIIEHSRLGAMTRKAEMSSDLMLYYVTWSDLLVSRGGIAKTSMILTTTTTTCLHPLIPFCDM